MDSDLDWDAADEYDPRLEKIAQNIISNAQATLNPHPAVGAYICNNWDVMIRSSYGKSTHRYQQLYNYLVACTTRLGEGHEELKAACNESLQKMMDHFMAAVENGHFESANTNNFRALLTAFYLSNRLKS